MLTKGVPLEELEELDELDELEELDEELELLDELELELLDEELELVAPLEPPGSSSPPPQPASAKLINEDKPNTFSFRGSAPRPVGSLQPGQTIAWYTPFDSFIFIFILPAKQCCSVRLILIAHVEAGI